MCFVNHGSTNLMLTLRLRLASMWLSLALWSTVAKAATDVNATLLVDASSQQNDVLNAAKNGSAAWNPCSAGSAELDAAHAHFVRTLLGKKVLHPRFWHSIHCTCMLE